MLVKECERLYGLVKLITDQEKLCSITTGDVRNEVLIDIPFWGARTNEEF